MKCRDGVHDNMFVQLEIKRGRVISCQRSLFLPVQLTRAQREGRDIETLLFITDDLCARLPGRRVVHFDGHHGMVYDDDGQTVMVYIMSCYGDEKKGVDRILGAGS